MTEMTLKVLPRPRTTRTLILRGLPLASGARAMARAMRSQAELAAAAFAPGDASLTALRLEGSAPSVEARAKLLTELLGTLEPMSDVDASSFWTSVRDGSRLGQGGPDDVLWRISVPLAAGGSVAEAVTGLGGKAMLDWAGGLVWALAPSAACGQVREIAEAAGGHALMVRAPESVRRTMPALHLEAPGVAALSARVKAAFDPNSILDPQRFSEAAT
jgi:glycolate oxidase FAD binding subunit